MGVWPAVLTHEGSTEVSNCLATSSISGWVCPPIQARCRRVFPCGSHRIRSHLLWWRRTVVTEKLCLMAVSNGVKWSLSRIFGLHCLLVSRLDIADTWFLLAAVCNGVSPFLFWAFGSHCLCDNSWTIVSSCSYLTAMCNGVFLELELWRLGLHLSSVMRYLTIPHYPTDMQCEVDSLHPHWVGYSEQSHLSYW